MGVKRQLLFLAYRVFKKSGILSARGVASPCVSILMFHRVNDYDRDFLTTPTGIFEEMLSVLSTQYRVVPLQAVIANIQEKQPIGPRTVVITFDDGYRDNFAVAAPLLKKYDLPATFFVTSGYVGTDRVFPWDRESSSRLPLMNWDELRELDRMGFEIGGHTINHVDLGVVSVEEASSEIIECKKDIESQIGKRISAFAYPFGRRNCIRPEIYPIIAKAGFNCCCSGYGGKNNENSDPYNLKRLSMYPTTIEMLMEIDGFMTFFDGKMSINIINPEKIDGLE